MIKMIAHIISSSVLIVAIWIVSFLMEKKMNPCIKYALWLLVVIKLLVPLPGFESDISVMNAVEKITPSQVSYLFVESEIEQDSVYDNHKNTKQPKYNNRSGNQPFSQSFFKVPPGNLDYRRIVMCRYLFVE